MFIRLDKNGLSIKYEKKLLACYDAAMRGDNSQNQLNEVVLQPSSDDVFDVDDDVDSSMWRRGYFKLFISHLTKNKASASNLKKCINLYGIDSFVAHEDIGVSREWQKEIENALFTMDALCAIVTPEFNRSPWCDQEVGIALGQKKPVISIAKGEMPYGFFGKYQALKSDGKMAQNIAHDVWLAITGNSKTKKSYFDTYLSLIINSSTKDDALDKLKILDDCPNTDRTVVMSLKEKYHETPVMGDKEVLSYINNILTKFEVEKIQVSKSSPIVTFDDLPF